MSPSIPVGVQMTSEVSVTVPNDAHGIEAALDDLASRVETAVDALSSQAQGSIVVGKIECSNGRLVVYLGAKQV